MSEQQFKYKIIFSTYCQSHLKERFGANKLINSFKYFHPNIPIVLYEDEELERVHKEYGWTNGLFRWGLDNTYPVCIMLDIKRKYNTEYVCHLDSDSICFGKLDEITKCDYEIASVRNDCDNDINHNINRPQCLWNLPNNKYVSCGCISTNSEKFLLEWIELNKQIVQKFGGVKSFWMCDQNWMNYLFHYQNYSSKILDPENSNLIYGRSINPPKEEDKNIEDPPHIIKEYGINSWKSWKYIEYNENDRNFYVNEKIVKLVHQAGGGNVNTVVKCHFDMFNDRTKKKLQEITGFNE